MSLREARMEKFSDKLEAEALEAEKRRLELEKKDEKAKKIIKKSSKKN